MEASTQRFLLLVLDKEKVTQTQYISNQLMRHLNFTFKLPFVPPIQHFVGLENQAHA